MRQDVAGRLVTHKTSSPCLPKHCLVVARRLLTGLQRDDVTLGAGDGTRTRDSLLGRQELYQLSYSRAKRKNVRHTVPGRGART
jgi:hypothetical protein